MEGRELFESFNENYVNIVENTSGKTPTHVTCDNNIFDTTFLFLIVGGE